VIDDRLAVAGGDAVAALVIRNFDDFPEELVRLSSLRWRSATVPAIYHFREYAEHGGLMSYGPIVVDTYRQVGVCNLSRWFDNCAICDHTIVQAGAPEPAPAMA